MTQLLTIRSNKPQKTVTLTDAAVAKVSELLAAENEPGLALRMAVRPGGCSGFSYELFFDSQIDDSDIVEEFGDVKVVVPEDEPVAVRPGLQPGRRRPEVSAQPGHMAVQRLAS